MMTTTVFPDLLSRPLSPDYTYRRILPKQSYSLEEKESFSSSLPLSLTKKDFDQLREVARTAKEQNWQETKAQRRGSGTFVSPRARSPTSQLSTSPLGYGTSRPRSASLCTSPRKTFFGIPKNRATSVKQRSSKQSTDEPSTLVIDTALAKIKNQLEQLSEEDQIMEDRVNRLMSEISKLASIQRTTTQNYHNSMTGFLLKDTPKPYKGYKRTLSDQSCRHRLLLTGDGHHNNIILSDLKETWEEGALDKSFEEEVNCVPFDLSCKEFDEDEGSKKRDSLVSTGSTDSATESSSSGVCVVVVTDASGHSHMAATTSQASGSSQAEDDVFLSQ